MINHLYLHVYFIYVDQGKHRDPKWSQKNFAKHWTSQLSGCNLFSFHPDRPYQDTEPKYLPKKSTKKYGKKQTSIENHDKNTTLVPLLLIRFHSFGHHSTAALSTGQGAEELIIEGFANAVAHLVRWKAMNRGTNGLDKNFEPHFSCVTQYFWGQKEWHDSADHIPDRFLRLRIAPVHGTLTALTPLNLRQSSSVCLPKNDGRTRTFKHMGIGQYL